MAYFKFNLVIELTHIISICNLNDVYNNLLKLVASSKWDEKQIVQHCKHTMMLSSRECSER